MNYSRVELFLLHPRIRHHRCRERHRRQHGRHCTHHFLFSISEFEKKIEQFEKSTIKIIYVLDPRFAIFKKSFYRL